MAALVISSRVFIQFTLAVVITLASALFFTQCLQKVLVLFMRALRCFYGMGELSLLPALHQQLPNKLSTKSFHKIRRNSLSVAMNWRKTVSKMNPSSQLSLTLLVWGREIRAWMFWLEAWKFITSAIYCECNFLGVCCVLQTVPSWFCSKCIKKPPLCFVIVFTPAPHHLKII